VQKKKNKKYPIFRLYWLTSKGESRYHTTRKNSFLYRLDGLSDLKTFKKCWWMIKYRPTRDWQNESIKYTDPAEAFRVAKIFTSPLEMKEWK